jgi:hypothetical protein
VDRRACHGGYGQRGRLLCHYLGPRKEHQAFGGTHARVSAADAGMPGHGTGGWHGRPVRPHHRFFSKSVARSFESIPDETIEALEVTGAGGVGHVTSTSLQGYDCGTAGVAILLVFLVAYGIERIFVRVKKKFY